MATIDEGLTSWQKPGNHNRMIELQSGAVTTTNASVEIAYFGHSAVRIKSQSGISVMIDPWRNHPSGGEWFFHNFPLMEVDIGVCTHAHFDHDALHRLDAHMLIDRLIGSYNFADVAITGFADKHATDFSATTYDISKPVKEFQSVNVLPPDNPRSRDNCLILVETGGLRLLHWGDNRADLPDHLWDTLSDVDVLFLPLDDSQHIISYEMGDAIIKRLRPRITVPIHYYICDVTQSQSTLLSPQKWLIGKNNVTRTEGSYMSLSREALSDPSPQICYFGDHVAFDVKRWHSESRC